MDILSGVMRLLRTEGHVYGRMELSGRFGLNSQMKIKMAFAYS